MSVEIGYALSSEEHAPRDLVRYATRAEECGFEFCAISDHYHPWIRAQGHSPFVWGVVGGIASATERIRLGTGVTCPTVRTHPGVIAHAAATAGCLMPGRFFLGVGSGEALNEHVFGDPWPSTPVRLEMLEEAVEVIRTLWSGGSHDFDGRFYALVDAQVFDLPDPRPEIVMAAAGPEAASWARTSPPRPTSSRPSSWSPRTTWPRAWCAVPTSTVTSRSCRSSPTAASP